MSGDPFQEFMRRAESSLERCADAVRACVSEYASVKEDKQRTVMTVHRGWTTLTHLLKVVANLEASISAHGTQVTHLSKNSPAFTNTSRSRRRVSWSTRTCSGCGRWCNVWSIHSITTSTVRLPKLPTHRSDNYWMT